MKKGYLIALFAGCTLLMMGCSNKQNDSATDPDAPAVTDNTGLTEGEAEVAGQGTDTNTSTATANDTTAGNGQGSGDGSQSSEADTAGSPAVSTGEKSAATPKNNKTETQSKKQTSSSSQEEDIGMEAAKKIALGKAGLTEQDGSWKEEKRDRENGRIVYELEFVSGNMEYDFEIDAQHGKILEYQQDPVND